MTEDPPAGGERIELRDGSETLDRRLDRLVLFDERSRAFPVRALLAPAQQRPRSYTWRIAVDYLIDQGTEGACVGFSCVNELLARPSEVRPGVGSGQHAAAEELALAAYHAAQHADPWAGCHLGRACPVDPAGPAMDGTAVLSGLQAIRARGYIDSFYWSFGLEDLVLALGRRGPAILGLWWYDTNYTPDARGFIGPRGRKVGGHAILARAVKIVWRAGMTWEAHGFDAVDLDRSYVTLRNSWGRWGFHGRGDCFVTLRDLGAWLDDEGEAAFALGRRTSV